MATTNTATRYTLTAYEARLDRLPGGPCEDIHEAACVECDDSGLTDCGCMAFDGPLDDCTSCGGDGCTWCGCAAGERRAAAWAAKATDYYTRRWDVCDEDIAW